MPLIFGQLGAAGFDVRATYHADAILREHFPEALAELEPSLLEVEVPVEELIRSGGGVAQVTQRLRRRLNGIGWLKAQFRIEKTINDRTTFAQSHEVDHTKVFESGTIALEIEWNNKDPFFDRDLENFNRLHADGAISVGLIITRGQSLQDQLESAIRAYAAANGVASYEDLRHLGISPTARQQAMVERQTRDGVRSFADAWAHAFVADKFGTATTHWSKLAARLDRGVGSPCPLVAIGIPFSCVTDVSIPIRNA
jgi:hypothetical protein